jgi:hypothetical protein
MVFEQVTTLQKYIVFFSKLQHCKNLWFLRKLQQHCKENMVFEQVTTTLQKSVQFLSK